MSITLSEQETIIKFRDGTSLYPITTWVESDRRYLRFGFNRKLIAELKSMEGARWSPERKVWYISNTPRNQFQLKFLANEPVYQRYDAALTFDDVPVERYNHRVQANLKLFGHQRTGVAHALQRHHCGLAFDMGCGKSLIALIAMEIASQKYSQYEAWYVAPKSALLSVQRDFTIWGSQIEPHWMTYEGLVKEMKNWRPGRKAPFFIVFDEFSKCKNYTSQRTQAARAIADGIRNDWGDDGYILGMTGTPAPKSPADWWSEAELLCPGFLREGTIEKHKRRLAIIIQKEGTTDRGSYPQLLGWRDNEKRCNICAQFPEHQNHIEEMIGIYPENHHYIPSVNEVAKLGERLKGLFIVALKKDCLDLPEKHYRVIEVKPKPSTLRAAALIARTARTTIDGLTRLRELSDGFQYTDTKTGTRVCDLCKGNASIVAPKEIEGTCPNCNQAIVENDFDRFNNCSNHQPQYVQELQTCPRCDGKGVIDVYERTTDSVSCPKDDAFDELLDEFEDVGRVVVYGGFTGTIDRVIGLCHRRGWYTIRMDQGKIVIANPQGAVLDIPDFQKMFLDDLEVYDKVAFVAHPKSGGMGLTLTSSPVIIYFSNDFDGEARIQSEDRIHRPGMDNARGATIIDIVHLPSDLKVLENLKKKRELQAMTLGDFSAGLEAEGARIQ